MTFVHSSHVVTYFSKSLISSMHNRAYHVVHMYLLVLHKTSGIPEMTTAKHFYNLLATSSSGLLMWLFYSLAVSQRFQEGPGLSARYVLCTT